MIDYKSLLNPAQFQACTHGTGPVLVLAGAGSGKTRVITYRIAYLIEQGLFAPYNILAVTFTNKAAGEMKERVAAILDDTPGGVTVGTFHSTCARMLRQYADAIGRTQQFAIYDAKDSEAVVKTAMKKLELSTENFPPKQMMYAISAAKTNLKGPQDVAAEASYIFQRTLAQIYEEYERVLAQSNALDFGDLILKMVQMLKSQPEIGDRIRSRFQYLLVDEYQDTNKAQLELVRLMAGKAANLCVVGDDDQSIYAFRGADPTNILHFERQFPGTTVIKLEQNYRSTRNIVEASNAVAAQNRNRKAKRLFTDKPDGEKIVWLQARDERAEAGFVARKIKEYVTAGTRKPGHFAVIYRTNAQSRVMEEQLHNENLPYVIIGGTGFYQRKEIKDIIAYLRVIVDPKESLSLERIINVPRRGIGKTTMEKVIDHSFDRELSTFDAIRELLDAKELTGAAAKNLRAFTLFIEDMREKSHTLDVPNLVVATLKESGYYEMLEEEMRKDDRDARERKSNLDEFVSAATIYQREHEDAATLAGFLELTALSTSEDTSGYDGGQVMLMTMHGAKGLEFPVVFVTGLEDGLLPHENSKDDNRAIEEERRLFYVAMTRAKEELFLSAASTRRHMGVERYKTPSQFVGEVPKDYLKTIRVDAYGREDQPFLRQERRTVGSPGSANPWAASARKQINTVDAARAAVSSPKGSSPVFREKDAGPRFSEGDRVRHSKFGEGIVEHYDGVQRIRVKFTKPRQVKTLDLGYAKLEKLN